MVSHDPRCQKATHVAAPSEHLVDDNVSGVGGEKGQVKQVGRKRRLALSASSDSNSNYADDQDYQPPASGEEEDTSYEEPAPKRSRHVEEADEKQSGCTDEWQVPSSPLLDEEDDDEEDSSSSSDSEEDNEEVIEVPHPPPRTWVAKVEWALGLRGGKGTLADIYTTIEAAFPEEVDGKRNWKAAIRSCLSKNEKRKFYKPHGSSLTAGSGKDHLWSLVVPREGGATRPAVKRGRPAGRRATTTRRMTTRHSRRVEEQQQQPPQQEEEKAQELVMVHPQELMDELDDLPDVLVEQFAKEERMAQLLRQKELLEQDINRLLEDNTNADCADGLSPDQEDFLSHLLA